MPVLQHALVSAVNLAELHAQLIRRGVQADRAWQSLHDLGVEVFPFDEEQARLAGELAGSARRIALSAGDRACLALAIARKATVYTTNAAWKGLNLGVKAEVIG